MEKPTCMVEGCDRVQRAREVCDMHYQRLRKFDSVDLPARPTNEELFWAKVDKSGPLSTRRPQLGPCWIWTTPPMSNGYAFWQNGKVKTLGHRFSYESAYGAIPQGLHIDHLCGNRICVRPDHLEAVTQAENNRRAAAVRTRKTHCPQGHPYSGPNLYVTTKGQHICRICRDASLRAFHERRKAAVA